MTLADRLRERIEREGPITFHDYMEAALYDPDGGYYARGPRIGGTGADFSTSVSFESFRDAIATLVERLALPRVVELGAGTGLLARTVKERVPDVEYVTVDVSPGLRAQQTRVPGVRAVATTRELAPGPTLVFANELLDALPVRRVVGGPDETLLEVHVALSNDGKFRERLLPMRDAAVHARLRREGVLPQRGQIIDVAPALEDLVRDAARLADPGVLVLIDYGDVAKKLYAPTRLNGTLAVYKSHGRFYDAFEEVGERDITADVDFTAVEHAAREACMEPLGLMLQGDFLEALGTSPDDIVARPSALGSAFLVFAAQRGMRVAWPPPEPSLR
ncbi:MAG: SAM-dependent methyltransferase [Candidatus Thermoplasmatota archaeon]